jgi:hypothetical protein
VLWYLPAPRGVVSSGIHTSLLTQAQVCVWVGVLLPLFTSKGKPGPTGRGGGGGECYRKEARSTRPYNACMQQKKKKN